MNTITLTPDQVLLLEHGNKVETPGGVYYHLPFWFKTTNETNKFEVLTKSEIHIYGNN